jgi:hypothetical protein
VADPYHRAGSYNQPKGSIGTAALSKRPAKFTVHWEDGSTSHMTPDEHKAYVASSKAFNEGSAGDRHK